RIVAVTFDGLQPLDLVGPMEVFATAARIAGDPDGYELIVASLDGTAVTSTSGLVVGAHRSLGSLLDGPSPLGTLLVVGGFGVQQAATDRELVGAVAELASRARRVAGVCSGAFVLAAAGLLEGRRAVTHWSRCDLLAELFPTIEVDADPIFVRDEHV